jgi:hypothetical protein
MLQGIDRMSVGGVRRERRKKKRVTFEGGNGVVVRRRVMLMQVVERMLKMFMRKCINVVYAERGCFGTGMARTKAPARRARLMQDAAPPLVTPVVQPVAPVVVVPVVQQVVPTAPWVLPPNAPPPVMVNGEVEWVVERIVDHRRRYGELQFRVRWAGWTREVDQWMLESEVAELAAFDVYEADMIRRFGANWKQLDIITLDFD